MSVSIAKNGCAMEMQSLLESVITNFNEHAQQDYGHIHSDCTKQLSLSYDFEKTIPVENEHIFSFYRAGLVPIDITQCFRYLRSFEENKYSFPGFFVVSNGSSNNNYEHMRQMLPASCCTDFYHILSAFCALKNSFGYKREAFLNLVLLKYFYNKGLPIKAWTTMCYGWQSMIYTLHALTSDSRIAQEIRKIVGIDRILAQELIDNLRFIRVQAPTINPIDGIEKKTETISQYVTRACLVGSGLVGAYSAFINNQKSMVPLAISGSLALGYYFNTPFIDGYTNNIVAECTLRYAMPFLSEMSATSRDGMQLLYDIQKSGQRFKNITLFMSWQAGDHYVKSPSVKDMQLYAKMFRFYGIGSPFDNHMVEDVRQKLFGNKICEISNVAFFRNEFCNTWGNRIYNALDNYHENNNWEELKAYTEDIHYYPNVLLNS